MNTHPTLEFGEPVVAAVSAPGETRWGYTQFPALSPLPDGRILLIYADAEDASETHGDPAPALVTADGGVTWQPFVDELVPSRPHYAITAGHDGEFFTVPSIHYFDVEREGVPLPAPIAESFVYGPVYTYRAADFPAKVRHHFARLEARRWRPATQRWEDTIITYDTQDLLVWRRENSTLLPRTFFERPATRLGTELFYADYRVRYALPDGHIPAKGGTHLMVSSDNGRSFHPRSVVGVDRSGRDLMGEAALAATADGGLVCIMRKTDHEQKPMVIAHSADAGHTWTAPAEMGTFGVFPYLLRLPAGPLVLSYGRPGVWLQVNADGCGRDWSEPVPVIAGDHAAVQAHSCGYTSMHVTGPDSLLLAYSDFQHRAPDGTVHKAILTRRVTVRS